MHEVELHFMFPFIETNILYKIFIYLILIHVANAFSHSVFEEYWLIRLY